MDDRKIEEVISEDECYDSTGSQQLTEQQKHENKENSKKNNFNRYIDNGIFGMIKYILIIVFIILLWAMFSKPPRIDIINEIIELLKALLFGATGYVYAKYKE